MADAPQAQSSTTSVQDPTGATPGVGLEPLQRVDTPRSSDTPTISSQKNPALEEETKSSAAEAENKEQHDNDIVVGWDGPDDPEKPTHVRFNDPSSCMPAYTRMQVVPEAQMGGSLDCVFVHLHLANRHKIDSLTIDYSFEVRRRASTSSRSMRRAFSTLTARRTRKTPQAR